ncbi:hypothetical protein [Elongatibacter sediminis]|uniref:Uncharacterized protein n=1 Tax=Elongatibacter sediminis TaxID=3119006 RepID=A0AAW9RE22_9GAMM
MIAIGETDIAPIKAWRCIGCGRIEAPAPCLGICEDRVVELVEATTHQALVEDYRALRELVLQLARTTPREGQFAATYRAMQKRAAELLAHRPAR